MADKRKGGARSGERQEAIRQAAYGCFRDKGYHETSVDAVCGAADISKGSFYWYYPSKQAVFVDILETWARQVMDEVLQQFERAVTRDDYVSALTHALQREVHRGRSIVPLWLEFTAHARREPEIQEALARFYSRARIAIVEMLRPFTGAWLSEEEVRGIAAAIFGAYAGLVMQDLADPDGADAEASMGHLMTFLGRLLDQIDPA
jgi:TetR/AcrR family transcriptional regulator, repressor for uid operon